MAQVLAGGGEQNKTYRSDLAADSDPLVTRRRQFSITYYVSATTSETHEEIAAATGIPKHNSIREKAVLIAKRVRELDAAAGLYAVECEYDSHADALSNAGSIDENAARRALDYDIATETYEEVITQDVITGKEIANAVGQPFFITTDFPILVLNISQVVGAYDFTVHKTYLNKVNKTDFWTFPPKTVLLQAISDRPVEEDTILRRKLTFTFKVNQRKLKSYYSNNATGDILGWRVALLNHGDWYYEDLATKLPKRFEDKFKDRITGNLTLEGLRLPDGQPPYYLTWDVKEEIDFNALGIGGPPT